MIQKLQICKDCGESFTVGTLAKDEYMQGDRKPSGLSMEIVPVEFEKPPAGRTCPRCRYRNRREKAWKARQKKLGTKMNKFPAQPKRRRIKPLEGQATFLRMESEYE